jgi:hypothetical protein
MDMPNDKALSVTAWLPYGPRGEAGVKSTDPDTGEIFFFGLFSYGNPVMDKKFDELDMLRRLNGKERVVARILCLWAVNGPVFEYFEPVPSKDISPDLPGIRIATGKPDPRGPFPDEEIASGLKRAHELCPRIEARIRELLEIRAEFKPLLLPPVEISPINDGIENSYLPRLKYITLDDLLFSAIVMLKRFTDELGRMPRLRDMRAERAARKRAAWFIKRQAIAYALFRVLTERADPAAPHMEAYALIGRFERDFLGRDIGYGTSGETETVRVQVMEFRQGPRKAQMDDILEHLLALNWPSV